ncbi:MAG: phosphate ABC transporter permease subunit PstC [Oculatellaceae cyanobacterium Prado106]|nr:phosphate ABC transporter permease subunit PstC [Oculatellaceae cyanobacterium Prado106]
MTVSARSEIDITASDGAASSIDRGFTGLVKAIACLTVFILFWMTWVILTSALPAIQAFGLGFLTSQDWDIGNLVFGGLPYIYGTLMTAAIAILLALPVGIAVALMTSENFLPRWVRSPLALLVELIAAIPSVIIGLWGIFIFLDFLAPIQSWLFQNFGWIPLFSTEPSSGYGLMAAGVILAIMILPTIATITREVLLALPKELTSASRALGATRWETLFRVILPTATPGILGAATLGLGRALGETMAVTMVIGNIAQISPSLFDSAYTIPAVLANEFGEALDQLHIGSLTYLALVLFVVTFLVNMVAVSIARGFTQK